MLFGSIGSLLILVGSIWLIIVAIQTGQTTGEKVLWALVNFLCQPLGGIIFFIVKREGLAPLILVIVGCILTGFGVPSMFEDLKRAVPK